MTTLIEMGMSLEAFIQHYEEQPFELLEGEIIPMSPSVSGPSYLANKLAQFINFYAIPKGLGEAVVEMVFVLGDDPQWVKGSRVPDVMYLQTARFAAYKQANPNWQAEPLRLIPDLVVEVMSPTDRFVTIHEKVQLYLKDGVKMVWVIEPERRTVSIPVPDSKLYTVLTEADKLSGGEVIPGFEIEIAALFEA